MATVRDVQKEGFIPYPKKEEVRVPGRKPVVLPRPVRQPMPA